jgi:hypothetical protein
MSSYDKDHARHEARELFNRKKRIFTAVPNAETKAAFLEAAQELTKITYFPESVRREIEEAISSVATQAVVCQ